MSGIDAPISLRPGENGEPHRPFVAAAPMAMLYNGVAVAALWTRAEVCTMSVDGRLRPREVEART